MRKSALARLGIFVAFVFVLVAPASASAFPGANGKIYFQACDPGCTGFDVWAVNPDGSGLENVTDVVTDGPGLPDNAFDPSVSADGTRMAFGVDSQATSEIWVMNTDGSGAKQLTSDNLLDQEPTISPDGSRIAWNQWSPFPGYTDRDIWVMNADGSGQELLFDGFGTDLFPQFTPDGATIVMTAETGDQDVRKVPSTPAAPPLTTAVGVAEDDEFLESEPAVSPDGGTVAFTQTPKAMSFGPFDIYAVSIEGGPRQPLFATAASETSPAYSPDGTKLLFGRDGAPLIGNADGSGTPQPLDVGALESIGRFDWAPRPADPPAGGGGSTGDGGGGGANVGGGGDKVENQAPSTQLKKHPPKRTTKRLARFTFGSSEPGSRFECKLDKKPFRGCKSPYEKKVKPGKHKFQVRAVDAQSAPDLTPAVFRWRVLLP